MSVELDAIAPDDLRALVEKAINRYLPKNKLRALRAVEQNERATLAQFAETSRIGGGR